MRKILLVEDDHDISYEWSELIKLQGYSVLTYEDAEKAVRAIWTGLKYDLAIVDQSLGIVTGNDVMEASRERNPDTPIILFSGYGYRHPNANYYFTKGKNDETDLENMIERCLREKQAQ